jgi:hypothetical protein
MAKDYRKKETIDKRELIIQDSKKGINLGKQIMGEFFISKKDNSPLVNEIKLSNEDKKLAQEIKNKLKKTAQTIVEIGEALTNAIKYKKRGFKEAFYEEIGISDRSAQRYMKIANHPKIIDLKENELEGKTMSDLLKLISPDTSMKSEKIDTKRIANGFYTRYKDRPETLKDIIKELQELLEKSTI